MVDDAQTPTPQPAQHPDEPPMERWRKGALLPSAVAPERGERFVEQLAHRGVVIEQIISSAHPEQTDYVQEQDEWVVLLEGGAILEVGGEEVLLAAGEHLFLPARTPHRVVSSVQGSRWLAVHIHPEA